MTASDSSPSLVLLQHSMLGPLPDADSASEPGTEFWMPRLSPKGAELYWSEKRYQLVSGPRYSGKTFSVLHRLTKHAFDVPNARVAVVAISQTSASDEGAWQLLIQYIIPEWIAANIGLEWIREPYQDGITKKSKCSIKNRHGGESFFQLESLSNEDAVEAKFLGKVFTAIYISELSNFFQRKTFDILIPTLRAPWCRYEDSMLISDCNPSREGPDSWIVKLFRDFRVSSDVTEEEKSLQSELGFMEMFIDDNPFGDPRMVATLKATYANNPDLYNRFILGKWTRSTGDGIFDKVLLPNIHFVGEAASHVNPDPEILVPSENCSELCSGFDMGDVNSAAHIIEPYQMIMESGEEKLAFNVLDELAFIGEPMSTQEFTLLFMEKMDFWEKFLGRKVIWTHRSDQSAFIRFRASSNSYDAMEVARASNGRVVLEEDTRYPQSVGPRVRIMRKLLFEQRIFISAAKCPGLMESLQSLRQGKVKTDSLDDKSSRFKHCFDSVTYALSSFCHEELEQAIRFPLTKRLQGGLISMKL